MNIKYCLRILVGVVAAMLFTSAPLHAVEKPRVIDVSGEISMVDVKLGKLQLDANSLQDRGDSTEYKINENNTRVTDPTDKKFLKLEDLRIGQRVTVEFNYNKGEFVKVPLAQKIIANPMPASVDEKVLQGSTNTTTTTTTSTTTRQ